MGWRWEGLVQAHAANMAGVGTAHTKRKAGHWHMCVATRRTPQSLISHGTTHHNGLHQL